MTIRTLIGKVLDTPLQSFLPSGDTVQVVIFCIVVVWGFLWVVGSIGAYFEERRRQERIAERAKGLRRLSQ